MKEDLPEKLREAIEKRKAKKMDPTSEAAMEIVNLDRTREQLAASEQEDREQRIAECYQFLGRIQAFGLVEKVVTVSGLMQLRQMKETKIYRAIPGIETWDKFCESIGYSSRHINDQLQNLQILGEQFLETVSGFQIGYRELRKLRKLNANGDLQISDNEVVIGDEHIPLSPDSKEDLEVALERLLEAKNQIIEEKDATIRANKKVIESKQALITRQEKDLAKYEKAEEAKGPDAWETDYIQKVRNARITIEGYLNQFDPELNPLPEGYTPRMANELMLTLQSFVRSTKASYDTAADVYGDPDLDGGTGWIPPHLRTEDNQEA